MSDNEFIAKTVNDRKTNLAQYPAAKVQQIAKKLESRNAAAQHIKQLMLDMQGGAQINILRHNHTSLPAKKKKGGKKPNQIKGIKSQQPQQQRQPYQQQSYNRNPNQCTRCGDSPYAPGFNCPAKKYLCKQCNKLDTSPNCALPKMHTHSYSNIVKVSQNNHTKSLYVNNPMTGIRVQMNENIDFLIAFQLQAEPQ